MAKNEIYELIDSGNGRKLERFGDYILDRPCAQALWHPQQKGSVWQHADAIFSRADGNNWEYKSSLKPSWRVTVEGIKFRLSCTDFGHLGIFPEQRDAWRWIQDAIESAKPHYDRPIEVLNLFAYSGGTSLAAAKAGANVCHLDASKGMVEWARGNSELNNLKDTSIRWIVDDVRKFLAREIRRGRRYDAIALDPPSFGHGKRGEIFKIEDDLWEILEQCRQLLSDRPLFFLLSAHTAGYSPAVMRNIVHQLMSKHRGLIVPGEMCLKGEADVYELPSGTYARWSNNDFL